MNIKQKKVLLALIKQYKNTKKSLQQGKLNLSPKNTLMFNALKKTLDNSKVRYKIGSSKIKGTVMFLFPNNTGIGISTAKEFKYTSYAKGKQIITSDNISKVIQSIIGEK